MIIKDKETKNNVFYKEVCMLRLLARMGYISEADLPGIIKIAEEDYGASLVLDKTLLSVLITLRILTGYSRTDEVL